MSRSDVPSRESTRRVGRVAPPGQELSIEELHLTVLDGPTAGQEIPCGTGAVRIGSAPDNDLVLRDDTVSRHHAVLSPQDGQLIIKDLDSTNGTFVAEVQVREGIVHAGTTIRIADRSLRIDIKTRRTAIPLSESRRFGHLVGKSPKMRQLFTVLEWIAPTDATLMVCGPTGTGKELVARSVHEASRRSQGPLVVLDCGATEPGLLSSDLFGHEAGAFTGATGRRVGVFEEATGGTLFIDEIGELPLDLQPKLLRVIETRQMRRLGGNVTISIDVRIITATHRDLSAMIARGEFREDLYFRLSQLKVTLPPLAERREDIPLMVDQFVERMKGKGERQTVSPEATAFLSRCAFKGNVRQLRNLVERAAMIAHGRRIEMSDLLLFGEELDELMPISKGSPGESASTAAAADVARCDPARAGEEIQTPGSGPDTLELPAATESGAPADERAAILAALEQTRGNLAHAARALGIALNTLKARMTRHAIPRPRARSKS